jgi:hypothetical protein
VKSFEVFWVGGEQREVFGEGYGDLMTVTGDGDPLAVVIDLEVRLRPVGVECERLVVG